MEDHLERSADWDRHTASRPNVVAWLTPRTLSISYLAVVRLRTIFPHAFLVLPSASTRPILLKHTCSKPRFSVSEPAEES